MKSVDFLELSDKEIISLIVDQGEKKALAVLYDRYAGGVYRKCLAMCNNTEQAQDLAHDVLLQSFLKLSSLKNRDSYKFWVNRIAYNVCIDYLNLKKKMKTDNLDDKSSELVMDDSSNRDEKILKEIRLEQLELLFKKLPEQDRIILLMQYQDALRIEDISEILQISNSAVKMRLKRAKEKLARMYENLAMQES